MKLISYCIPSDDGAAPNPFFGVCTLVICKPVIRRVTAQVGDWIVGCGSTNVKDAASGKSYGNRLVYAMRVSQKMTMAEYDAYAQLDLPGKLPDPNSLNAKRRVGDAIYDFSNAAGPMQRPGVHDALNIVTDLGGKNALVSDHFYYFGAFAVPIPKNLLGIVHQTQGHKYKTNAAYLNDFLEWIGHFPLGRNGMPYSFAPGAKFTSSCSVLRSQGDSEDERLVSRDDA